MKHYLRSLIISAIAFYAAFTAVPTMSLGNDPKNIAIVIAGVFLTSVIVRPIFSIVLLPINFLTFGLLSLVLNIVLFFGLSKFLPGFSISAYNFPGMNLQGFVLPSTYLNQLETLVTVALIITLVQKVLHIIFE
ncbi:MAG TPA: phage holin family protein [Candidatus Saccharimonadales bacterium]|nr:phage holin family protein [Candidatus Saccharimonadales bacterium]